MGTVSTPFNLPTLECVRCGHTWHPRKQERPIRCGGCKTPYWDRAKLTRKRKRK